MAPLVTIYLPTRGRPSLLTRAVKSALGQDYPRFEVMVVVDGPCEASRRVLSHFAADARVSVHYRDTPGGAPRARNDAIERAKGDLITGLDDDDELQPQHLSTLVQCLDHSKAAFACTTNLLRRRTGDVVRHPFRGRVELDQLLRENVVGNQVLTRTEYMKALGGFDAEMPAWQDYDLWIRLCNKFGFGQRVDARSYVQYVEHESPRISEPERIALAHARLVKKHERLLTPEQRLSLELLMYATTHTPFPLRRLPQYVNAGLTLRAGAALLSDRLPMLRGALRWAQASALVKAKPP